MEDLKNLFIQNIVSNDVWGNYGHRDFFYCCVHSGEEEQLNISKQIIDEIYKNSMPRSNTSTLMYNFAMRYSPIAGGVYIDRGEISYIVLDYILTYLKDIGMISRCIDGYDPYWQDPLLDAAQYTGKENIEFVKVWLKHGVLVNFDMEEITNLPDDHPNKKDIVTMLENSIKSLDNQ